MLVRVLDAAGYRLSIARPTRQLELGGLPGADLIAAGIEDLDRGVESVEAFLVSIGAPRLAILGFRVSSPLFSSELRLYQLLAADDPDAAHSRYNALVRRLVRSEQAAEWAS